MTENIEDGSSKPRVQDRVTLGKEEVAKVDGWLRQVSESSRGFLCLNKSDIVNFLIRLHKEVLPDKELRQIRADHYDPIRHIHWLMPQLKEALAGTDTALIARLQEELRGIELSVTKSAMEAIGRVEEGLRPSEKVRKPRKKRQSEIIAESSAQSVRTTEISG